MADEHKVEKQKVKLKNTGRAPQVIIDAGGAQHLIGPGVETEVELPKPQAEAFKKIAERGGGNLAVDGTDPAHAAKDDDAPKEPEEQKSRSALAKKETELMQAGQDASKDARDKMARKDWHKLAAETGIGIMARGGPDALETVAEAPDAPAAESKPKSSAPAHNPGHGHAAHEKK